MTTLRLLGGHTLPFVGVAADANPPISGGLSAVLNGALRGDRNAVTRAIDEVVERDGVRGAYDVAWEMASAVVGDAPPGRFAALDFPQIERARYDARWVARFVTAVANADAPSGEALFGAAMADGEISQCLLTLAGSLVATLRQRGDDVRPA